MFLKVTTFFVFATIITTGLASPKARLSGGQDVDDIRRFPHHVYIIPLQSEHKCGGSILNAQWVLTSAECIKDNQRLELHFGKKNQNNDTAEYFTCIVKRDQVFVYPTNFDDLAMIRLPMMLMFSETIMPVNISRSSIEELHNQFVVMPGFNENSVTLPSKTSTTGVPLTTSTASESYRSTRRAALSTKRPLISTATSLRSPIPTPAVRNRRSFTSVNGNLKYGMFRVLDNNVCKRLLEDGSKFDEYTQICIDGWGKSNNTPCESDFGSGLVKGWPDKSELIGMFSMYSPSCDKSKPAVFTYIAKYLPWIDSMIED